MNPLMLYRSLPYAIIVALSIALAVTVGLYQNKRDQLVALAASVQALGQAAEKIVEEKKIEHANNLETVRQKHEALASTIRYTAVNNYRRMHPAAVRVRNDCSRRGEMPRTATGQPVDDGTIEELVLDPETIANAAEDASKLSAFQELCVLNRCPVKD